MGRASVRFIFQVFVIVILAACQSAPGGPPPVGDTSLATEPSQIPPGGTPAPPQPSPAAATPTAQTASATAPASPPMVHFENGEFGYQIDVPAEASINSEQLELVRIDLPMPAGTTLSEKYLEISATRGQAECSSPYALGFDPAALESETVVYNGIEFLQQSGSEGAAGSVYEFTSYSAQKDDICVSLSFVLHSANPDVLDTPPPPFDSQAEKAVIEAILQTFTWTGE